MPQQGIIYRVLVASPSDCVRERQLVPDIIYAWNAAHSLPLGAILEPVLWETHARPELGERPQGIINKQLVSNCDLLIGTFWTRLGTSTGKAESGTAEEIEEFRAAGKRVLLYFSSAPVVLDGVDLAQYESLKAYKKKLGAAGLYFQYDSLEQLRSLLQRHVAATMAELHRSSTPDKGPTEDNTTTQEEQIRQYGSQVDSFLRRFEAEWASFERKPGAAAVEEAKLTLDVGLDQVLSLRSQITSGLSPVAAILDEAAKELRTLRRHRLALDGGRSVRQFWERGDAIISRLKEIPALLSDQAKDGA